MQIILFLSDLIMPLTIFYIVGFGMLMKKNVYEDFVKGAVDGAKIVVDIMPTLIGLMVAVGILRESGFLDCIGNILGSVIDSRIIPAPIIPVAIVKLFSSSAATGLVLDIFKTYGTDSFVGIMVSIMMSCTETVFYTMSVYFMAAKVKKTRYTLVGALFATAVNIIFSIIITHMLTNFGG